MDLDYLHEFATIKYTILGLVSVLFFSLIFLKQPPFDENAPKVISGNLPIVGHLGFWTQRFQLWKNGQREVNSQDFSFHVGKYQIVAACSEAGQKSYFESKSLDLAAGYAVLFGQTPDFTESTSGVGVMQEGNYFIKRITALMKREVLAKRLGDMCSDVRERLEDIALKAPGSFDPFNDIYKLVFQLTMRVAGPHEIATDRALEEKVLSLFESIESTAKPYQIIFPWLPSPALFTRLIAGTRMYTLFRKIINNRRSSGIRHDDALQFCIDQGDDLQRIIQFTVGTLFAGQLNSGINACWLLCYLAENPLWLAKIRKEVLQAVNAHNPDPSVPIVEKLSALPLESWESEFPCNDLCLRESIRLQLHGTGFRRNISGAPVKINDKSTVPPGGFVLFHFGAHHIDPEIYQNPHIFDPTRFLPPREEHQKFPHAYAGWGSGRHPCLGMKFAKLEQNIMSAYFVTMFDFELANPLPPVDNNNFNASKPVEQVRIRIRLRPIGS